MLYWIHELLRHGDTFVSKFTNVFQYESFRSTVACLLAFSLSLLFGERVIRKLISLKVGQPVRSAEEVHKLFETHGKKAGTPTMGGVLIVFSLVIAMLVSCNLTNPLVWVVLFVTLGLGALGFVDDYKKVKEKNSAGVSSKFKLVWQWGVGLIAGYWIWHLSQSQEGGEFFQKLQVPFFKRATPGLGWWVIPFTALVIVGCSNAVNFTDGLDGLASGCTVSVGLAYGLFCYLAGKEKAAEYLGILHHPMVAELAPISLGLVGAALGFLWFNCHPARMFMGDTGSLAIGGCIASLAICSRQEILLVIVGGVFVIEALSVMLQVSWFKLSRKLYGEPRRLFRMTPIHHHFELKGWKENQVITRFWMMSLIFALMGVATLKLR